MRFLTFLRFLSSISPEPNPAIALWYNDCQHPYQRD